MSHGPTVGVIIELCYWCISKVMPNLALCPRQRLVDDFLLSPEMVLESFLSYGLVEEAVEYAKVGSKCILNTTHDVQVYHVGVGVVPCIL